MNTTLEGMKEREILDGDPSKVPHGDDEELTKMRMMMSLMTETTVDLDQVVEKFQRSLLTTPRISSTKTKIQKR